VIQAHLFGLLYLLMSPVDQRQLLCVLRDAEYHQLTREINELRAGAPMASYRAVLGAKLNIRQQALLQLALSFFTWRTLVFDAG
jgi:hypothetical protein